MIKPNRINNIFNLQSSIFNLNLPWLIAILLVAIGFVTGIRLPAVTWPNEPILSGFYPPEQNRNFDYTFTQPEANILIATLNLGRAALRLRIFAPEPLPDRRLRVAADGIAWFEQTIDPTPRVYRLLLREGEPRTRPAMLFGLKVAAAHIPNDPRSLGILVEDLRIERLAAPPTRLPTAALLLASLAAGLAAASGPALARATHARRWSVVCCLTVLVAMIVVITGILAAYSIVWHDLFRTSTFDIGVADQWLWLISRGLTPYSTGAGVHLLGDHAAVLFYPLALLYTVVSDLRALLVLQAFVMALGIVPLYLIGRDHGAAWAGLVIGAAYLLHPATQNAALFEFHVDKLAATALLFTLWGVGRQRWGLVVAMSLFLLACKENFAITVAWLGLWLIMQRHWRIGGLLVVLGAVWFVVSTRLVIPLYFDAAQSSKDLERFAHLGRSPAEIAATLVLRPDRLLALLLTPERIWYLLQLLLPFALLPSLSPRWLLPAAPALGLNLLSNFLPQLTLTFHYSVLIMPVFAVAALYGLLWLRKLPLRRATVPLALIALIGGWWYVCQHTYLRINDIANQLGREQQVSFTYRYLLSRIPPDAAVSVQTWLQPHLSHRVQSYQFPNPFERAAFFNLAEIPFVPQVDYIVYDTRRPDDFYTPGRDKLRLLRELEQRGLYQRIVAINGTVLLQRTSRALPETCFGTGWNNPTCNESH